MQGIAGRGAGGAGAKRGAGAAQTPSGARAWYRDPALVVERSSGPASLHVDGECVVACWGALALPAGAGGAEPSPAAQVASWVADGSLASRLPGLDGSFALAIREGPLGEGGPGRLRLVSDRHASRSLFVGVRAGRLCFAPRLEPFGAHGFAPRLDARLALELLGFGYRAGERTLYPGVERLPPGSVLEWSGGEPKLDGYWTWRFAEKEPGAADYAEAVGELGERWLRAVERRLAGVDTIVVPLSGGLDSRAILAAALACRDASRIRTATFGVPGSLDFEIGCRVARAAGTRHLPLDLGARRPVAADYRDRARDGDGGVECANGLFLSAWQRVAELGDAVAVGYLGDPLMGSHRRPDASPGAGVPEPAGEARALAQAHLWPGPALPALLGLEPGALLEAAAAVVREGNAHNPQRSPAARAEWWDFRNRQQKFVMPQVFLMRDRCEYRSPFLDNELVDFALGLPPSWRIGLRLYGDMLLDRFPRLFALPTKGGDGLPLRPGAAARARRGALDLGVRALHRASRGRLRVVRWQRERRRVRQLNHVDHAALLRRDSALRRRLAEAVGHLGERGVIEARALEPVWREHASGARDHSPLLRRVLSLAWIHRVWAEPSR